METTYYIIFWLVYISVITAAVLMLRLIRTSGWQRILIINVTVFFAFLGFVFLAAEGFFIFFYDTTDTYGFVRTSTRWEHRHVRLNALGFRDNADYADNTPADAYRIGIIGDSFTFGQGINNVQNRYTDILQTLLKNKFHRPVVIYNLSRLGWDTNDHLDVSQRLLPSLHLNLVILAYNMNDIRDLTPQKMNIRNLYRLRPQWTYSIGHYSLFLDFIFVHLFLDRAITENGYKRLADAYADKSIWRFQAQRLRSLIRTLKNQKTPLFTIIFPMLGEEWSDYSLEKAHHQVQGLFQEEGIKTLDLLPFYDQYKHTSLWINRFDTHPNEQAQAIAAKQMFLAWFADGLPQ